MLCLDALDEDRKAIEDHRGRILELVKLTKGFRAVVITCRSQFFPTDEEIPVETGLLKIAVRAAGEEAEYLFRKFYLSPFTDDQVESYLRRRFSWYQHRERRRAREIAAKIGDLVARPMLLAHIEDLVGSDLDYEYAFQIYEEMVNSWLQREKGYVKDTEALREFSELVAVNLLLNQKQRGWERIPGSELQPLAEAHQIPLQGWQLRGRSLLNKDADGNYKFAHRSVMEYLFAKRFALGKVAFHPGLWTDQIQSFFFEMVRHGRVGNSKIDFQKLSELIPSPEQKDGLDYVLIPPGTFQMGSVKGDNAAQRYEKPQHQVDITRAVFMGRTAVTVAAYRRFAQATERVMPTAPEFNRGREKEDHPIVNVSWEDAKAYCEWAGGRLPTEAEWEYAARGEKEGLKYPWGDEISEEHANYGRNVGGTSVVGSYPANDFGLYDMAGNVWEWVADGYDQNYYSKSPKKNP